MSVERQILRGHKPTIVPAHRVKDIDQLRALLQSAVMLEHTTIPPYLCALYSIKEGTNREAVEVILSVVMEEMLHMVLAANVLTAIGGKPRINQKQFVPDYPVDLSLLKLTVNLSRFSKDAMDSFIEIERPDDIVTSQPPVGCCHFSELNSIAQFYELIETGLTELEKAAQSDDATIFTGNTNHQIGPEHYYGGGGAAIRVTDLDSALSALNEVIGQGEGIPHSIWESPDPNPGRADFLEVAHFYRFIEIRKEQQYRGDETLPPRNGKYPEPKGQKVHVCWDDVYPMRTNPKMAHLPCGSEALEKATAFNRAYMNLLDNLHDAMNGRPGLMMSSVGLMYDLKYQAIELMKFPMPGSNETVGPSFEYLAPERT